MNDCFLHIRDRQSALAFLFGRIDYERGRHIPYRSRRFKLDRMRQLLARLGHPERDVPAIHVAGTKGKGSTAAMIASALTAAGYRTGLYTSPHLERLEERFVVNARECSADELVQLLARIAPEVAEMDRHAASQDDRQGPTYFEITTAAALLHFRRCNVDCAVLEVGLGGRLDSTNVCHPIVSVITSISLDHVQQLGSTLGLIAREKAGIIKRGIPVITGVEQAEPLRAIRQAADDCDARLLALGRDFRYQYVPRLASPGIGFESAILRNQINGFHYQEAVDGQERELRDIALGLLGRHQATNASVALATLHQLRRQGWTIPEIAIRRALAEAHCPARIEVAAQRPTVILDAAHNAASVAALLEVLNEHFAQRPRILVFAASKDKDASAMLHQLVPEFDHVILTRYRNNPRAVPPSVLAELVESIQRAGGASCVGVHACDDPESAWRQVQSIALPRHLICVTGSFFLAAEIRGFLVSSATVPLGCP